jgi:PleD family two-component response regulator
MVVVTGSFGITGITPGEVDTKIIIGRADAALYRAKEAGRNCVRVAEEQGGHCLTHIPPSGAT